MMLVTCAFTLHSTEVETEAKNLILVELCVGFGGKVVELYPSAEGSPCYDPSLLDVCDRRISEYLRSSVAQHKLQTNSS